MFPLLLRDILVSQDYLGCQGLTENEWVFCEESFGTCSLSISRFSSTYCSPFWMWLIPCLPHYSEYRQEGLRLRQRNSCPLHHAPFLVWKMASKQGAPTLWFNRGEFSNGLYFSFWYIFMEESQCLSEQSLFPLWLLILDGQLETLWRGLVYRGQLLGIVWQLVPFQHLKLVNQKLKHKVWLVTSGNPSPGS